jgi:membrane protein YqaA with SNARE-associated domain
LIIFFASVTGGLVGVFVAAFLGNRIRALFHKNKPTKEVAEKEHPKLLELWNKYGTIGLGFIVTVSVGAPISLAVGAGLNANFKN